MPAAHRKGDICISEDTLIPLLDGRVLPIKHIQPGDWVYSFDVALKLIQPGVVERVWQTGIEQQCMKVYLDNGETFICTPNHRVMLKSGRYQRVDKLKVGDSIMPLYTNTQYITSKRKTHRHYKHTQKGYQRVLQPNGEWQFTHRMVYIWKYGENITKTNKKVVHHKNFNSKDNRPSNLLACSPFEHWHYHSKNKSLEMQLKVAQGIHPWQQKHNIEKTRQRLKQSNPMFNKETREKQRNTLITNKSSYFRILNQTNNPAKDSNRMKKMVATRMSHPLGYQYGYQHTLTEEQSKKFSQRMCNNNPMHKHEVKEKRKTSTAKKYGFANNAEFTSFLQEQIKNGTSIHALTKQLGCDRETIASRITINHKVEKIELIDNINVWNMTVTKYHNFAINAGIFVSNCTGHGCFPPRANVQGSPDVFVNNIPQHRQTDGWASHCCGDPCHSSQMARGSPTVFANNLEAARIGDPVACGSAAAVGSPDVFIGESSSAGFFSLTEEEKKIIIEYQSTKSPTTGHYQHASLITDDELQDGVTMDNKNNQYRAAAAKMEGVNESEPHTTKDPNNQTPPPPQQQPVSADCSDIEAHQGAFPGSFKLSTNFTLAMVTTNTLVSNYAIKAQQGLTEKQIVCNLRALCLNVLEPMKAKYGSSMRINSGFRHGTNNSQHNKGQAADISFTDISGTEASYQRALEIRDTFDYDHLIYEQNTSIWYHVSYNKSGNRRRVDSKPRGPTYYSGILKIVT